MPTATLIVSPLASRIRDADTRARIVESAQASIVRRGIADIRVVVSGDHAEIRAAAAESVGRGDALVVVAGGDGTVRDATGPLAGTSLDVAILPCGTGNLYATAVGVPRSMPKALEAIATGSPTPVDHASVRLLAPAGA